MQSSFCPRSIHSREHQQVVAGVRDAGRRCRSAPHGSRRRGSARSAIWPIGVGQRREASIIARIASSVSSARKLRFPVVERALRVGGVQHRVHLRVRHRADRIHDGVPKALIGCTAASPSASDPQWQSTMAASFAPEPSGACTRPPKTVSSSGSRGS